MPLQGVSHDMTFRKLTVKYFTKLNKAHFFFFKKIIQKIIKNYNTTGIITNFLDVYFIFLIFVVFFQLIELFALFQKLFLSLSLFKFLERWKYQSTRHIRRPSGMQ